MADDDRHQLAFRIERKLLISGIRYCERLRGKSHFGGQSHQSTFGRVALQLPYRLALKRFFRVLALLLPFAFAAHFPRESLNNLRIAAECTDLQQAAQTLVSFKVNGFALLQNMPDWGVAFTGYLKAAAGIPDPRHGHFILGQRPRLI
ncbi:hypothetical protein D3C81_1034810 [compost metagenome]